MSAPAHLIEALEALLETARAGQVSEAAAAAEAVTAEDWYPVGERIELALEAAWELESIANVMLKAAGESETNNLFMRGMSIRNRQLASVVMSSLSDATESVPSIRKRLTGARGEADADGGDL